MKACPACGETRFPQWSFTIGGIWAGNLGEYICASCGFTSALPAVASAGAWTPPDQPAPEPETEPAQPPPVIDGSVIGYRAWRIKDWQLYGTGVNRAWMPGVNEATCSQGDPDSGGFMMTLSWFDGPLANQHPAPALGCHCGLTALARFTTDDAHWSSVDVHGAIEAWSDETLPAVQPGDVADAAGVSIEGEHGSHDDGGRFILHGTGFRAQYAKVVLLAVDDDWPVAKKAAVRALAQEHEADVCKLAHLETAAKEHGQLVPDEMLEWAKEGEPTGYLSSALQAQMATFAGQMVTAGMSSLAASLHTLPPPSKPESKKGICQTLGYPGPPSHGKFRKRDRVCDSKGAIWQCVKGGQPGFWEPEEVEP